MNENNANTVSKCIQFTLQNCISVNKKNGREIKELIKDKNIKKIIRDMNYLSCRACNKGSQMYLLHELKIINKKNNFKEMFLWN